MDDAEEAVRLAEADPARAIALADSAGRSARRRRDWVTVSVAERALGIAALYMKDVDSALRHLRAAVSYGERAGAVEVTIDARIRLAFTQGARGRLRQGLREVEAVQGLDLDPLRSAHAAAMRGAILQQLGRLEEALVDYQGAIPALRRADDLLWLQRTLSNRAVVHGYRHEFAAAASDLRDAERLCRAQGFELSLGFVHQNLGWVLGMQGDVPGALRYLDQAQHRFTALGADLAEVLTDRSEILQAALLTEEAIEAGTQAVALFSRNGRQTMGATVRIWLAQAALVAGRPEQAAEESRRAVKEFVRQQRPAWTVLGRYLLARAQAQQGQLGASAVRRLDLLATALLDAGWVASAIETRIMAGQLAQEHARPAEARRQLALAARYRTRGHVLLRVRAWYASALLREMEGNRRGARIAVRRGLQVIDDHRATFGAQDLRAHASGHRTDLASLGLHMALAEQRPDRVLEWAEEGRASRLRLPHVRPPHDPTLARIVADLRATVSEIEKAVGADRHDRRLLRRRLDLERAVRDHTRRLAAAPDSVEEIRPTTARIGAALGDSALVEFLRDEADLHAVVVVEGRASVHPLGPLDRVIDVLDQIPFTLRRLARASASTASRRAADGLLRHAAAALDGLVLAPLTRLTQGRPLVLVPTGPLQSLPWSVLPSCVARPVTVAPSAALWLAAHEAPDGGDGVVVAAGPGLPGAEREAAAIGRIHGVDPLVGAVATVDTVSAAIDGVHLAHLAAHGHVHPRNSLFSAIHLGDGPLAVHDLERLRRTPDLVVLSACNVGAHVVTSGDELLGLSATFLAAGTHQVVASVLPVPDVETASLMEAFHQVLAGGATAAAALATAQASVDPDDFAATAAAAGFVSMGAERPFTLGTSLL